MANLRTIRRLVSDNRAAKVVILENSGIGMQSSRSVLEKAVRRVSGKHRSCRFGEHETVLILLGRLRVVLLSTQSFLCAAKNTFCATVERHQVSH